MALFRHRFVSLLLLLLLHLLLMSLMVLLLLFGILEKGESSPSAAAHSTMHMKQRPKYVAKCMSKSV